MSSAQGSQHQTAFIKENLFGITPDLPVFQKLRHNGFSGGLNRTQLVSAELRSDRMISDMRLGNKQTSFEVPFEFSYGTFDALLEGALFGTWNANVLQAGITKSTFTMERYFSDIMQYIRHRGAVVDKFKLKLALDKMVEGSFAFVGNGDTELAPTILAGATYAEPTTTTPFDTFSGTILEGGVATAILTGVDFELDNGAQAQHVLMAQLADDINVKRSDLKGSVDLLFKNTTMYQKFVNETPSSLQFTVTDGDNSYIFEIPRIKYTSVKVDVSGDGPVPLNMPFQALYDAATGTNFRITRVPAV